MLSWLNHPNFAPQYMYIHISVQPGMNVNSTNLLKFEGCDKLVSQRYQHKVNESIQNLMDTANKYSSSSSVLQKV